MGCPMMAEKLPDNVKYWNPEHVKQYLEKHKNDLNIKDDDINNLYEQDVDGLCFLRLSEEKLTNRSGPYCIKAGAATRIIISLEKLKNQDETASAYIEVVTATEFKKFRKSINKVFVKLYKTIDKEIDSIYIKMGEDKKSMIERLQQEQDNDGYF